MNATILILRFHTSVNIGTEKIADLCRTSPETLLSTRLSRLPPSRGGMARLCRSTRYIRRESAQNTAGISSFSMSFALLSVPSYRNFEAKNNWLSRPPGMLQDPPVRRGNMRHAAPRDGSQPASRRPISPLLTSYLSQAAQHSLIPR